MIVHVFLPSLGAFEKTTGFEENSTKETKDSEKC